MRPFMATAYAGMTLGRLARGALAVAFRQVALAQADRLRGHLDQFVVVDEFHRPFERELDRRREQHVLVLARSSNIRELFSFDRVDDEIVVPRMDADDHALVDALAGR